MRGKSNRRAFTLRDLLMAIGVIAVLLAIAVPFIQRQREVSRMTECQNNLKQLGLALLNYTDLRRHFPPISLNMDSIPDIPGDATASIFGAKQGESATPAAGYSWQVEILPDIENADIYQAIVANSRKFFEPAFSPKIVDNQKQHIATLQVNEFLCPAFTNGPMLDSAPRITGAPGAPETGTLPPNYAAVSAGSKRGGLGITNYNAIAGTHIDQTTKSVSDPNNGGMTFRGKFAFDSGTRLSALTDGTAHVPLVCETRERRFSSWYDGTMNWVVAARHSDPANPSAALAAPATLLTESIVLGEVGGTHLPAGRLIIGTDGTPKTGGHALNVGPSPATPTAVYLPTAALNDPDISSAPPGRLWGPSSMHRSGLVNHVFGDGHVVAISDQIDANLYLWIVTRNGGEPNEESE